MSVPPVAAQQLLVGAQLTISAQFRDENGDAAAPAGTVTVDLLKADGSTLVAGGSTSGTGTAPRTYTLAAGSNTELQLLTAVWKDGGVERLRTMIEVVGGFYFSEAEIEAFDVSLGNVDSTKFRRVRAEVERECERLTGVAWVPRFRRERVSGTGTTTLALPDGLYAPRRVRSVRVYDDATSYTAFTAAELAAIECRQGGLLTRLDGNTWPRGTRNIVLEVEHGMDQPPKDLLHAAMTRFRWRYNMESIPAGVENATRWQVPGGATFEIPAEDVEISQPEVFRVYRQHDKRVVGVA